MKPKATLILGGGSALGLAHIGALEVLERHYEISGIIGTSMGAIIGALYASGLSPMEILQIATRISNARVFSPLNLDRRIQGIFDGKMLIRLYREWTNDEEIGNGRIPFIAVAYDLLSRSTMLFRDGKYAIALRASSSLPLIFSPFAHGPHLFVDGGIEHPLPLAFAGLFSSELVIAVNVLPYVQTKAHIVPAETKRTTKLKRVGQIEVVLQSTFHNQAYLALRDISAYAPDIVIDAAMPDGRPFAFHKAADFYRFGVRQTEKTLADYNEPNFIRRMRHHYRKLVMRKTALPDS